MKINQLILKAATEPIKNMVPKKLLIPYYGYILLTTTENGLEVRYTNQEASYKTILTGGYEGEFNLCIDTTLIEALGDVDAFLSFKIQDKRCVVSVKGRRLTLPILDPKSYPIESAENKLLFHANSADIKKAIEKCSGFGTSEPMSAYYGTRFSKKDSCVEVGSTDGFVAGYSLVSISCDKSFGFNVNTALCNVIKDICDKDELIHVLESDNDVQWQCGLSVLTTRKNSYRKTLVPYSDRLEKVVEVATDVVNISDRKWFVESLRTSSLFSDNSATALVDIILAENQITIDVDSDVGKKSEQYIECIYDKTGDSTEVLLNYGSFLRILGKLEEKDIALRLPPEGDPISSPVYINEGDNHFFLFPSFKN